LCLGHNGRGLCNSLRGNSQPMFGMLRRFDVQRPYERAIELMGYVVCDERSD
jgi:hypothetical protein